VSHLIDPSKLADKTKIPDVDDKLHPILLASADRRGASCYRSGVQELMTSSSERVSTMEGHILYIVSILFGRIKGRMSVVLLPLTSIHPGVLWGSAVPSNEMPKCR
jgi:hypothetical protein